MDKYRINEEGEFVKIPKGLLELLLEAVGVYPLYPELEGKPMPDEPEVQKESMAPAGKVSKEDKAAAYKALMHDVMTGKHEDEGEAGIIDIVISKMEDE